MNLPPAMKPNAQIREEAAAWFVEFNEAEVSLESRQAFSRWLKCSPEHVRAYLRVSATFDDLGQLSNHRTGEAQALIDQALAAGNVVELENRRGGEAAAQLPEVTPLVQGSALRTRRWSSFIPLGRQIPPPERDQQSAAAAPKTSSENRRIPIPLLGRAQGLAERHLLQARVALIVLSLGALALWWSSQRDLYTTGTGEQRIVNLADGSTIELNAESRVRVRLNDGDRVVDLLQGQALFHVAKDPLRPFIVHSDGTRVRAVGTQFDVNREGSDTVVTVLEGRVVVAHESSAGTASAPLPTDAVPLYVSAGEQVILTAQAASKPVHPDVAAATAWRERKLIFASSPLTQVITEYNRYHEKRLVLADPALADFKISGVFSAADSTSLIAFLRAQSNITVEERGGQIVLSSR